MRAMLFCLHKCTDLQPGKPVTFTHIGGWGGIGAGRTRQQMCELSTVQLLKGNG